MINVDFIQDLAIVLVGAGLAGWIFRSLGLSVTIGYLLAGIVIGPYTPPFALVTDTDRIQVLSQIGLVFLMFAIGLNLSFKKLSRLGLWLFIAVAIGVSLMILLGRLAGSLMHLNLLQSMFLAGMLLVSSSAIIGKMLNETNFIHQRFGQIAMAVTLLEDLAAIIMFSLLSTYVHFGEFGSSPVLSTLGMFMAFLVVLSVTALLSVPQFLSLLQRRASAELQSLLVAGLLFLLALLAAKAGYSLALGAFIMGVVLAETTQREQIERTFSGLNDIFTAVFFVAIGMQIDISLLYNIWPLILIIAGVAFLGRTVICSFAQMAVGRPVGEAIQTGLTLTPIGEFSFIIAQLGVVSGVLPPSYYPLAVGVCLLTTLASTAVIPRSDPFAYWVQHSLPPGLSRFIAAYHDLLERGRQRRGTSLLWRFTRKRLVQIVVEILFATGLLAFSNTLGDWLFNRVILNPNFLPGLVAIFWTVIGCLLLASIIAIWRNISALAMLFAQAVVRNQPPDRRYTMAIENLIKISAVFLLVIWLWIVVPFRSYAGWFLIPLAVSLVALASVSWRRMIFWHSVVERRLDIVLRPKTRSRLQAQLTSLAGWKLKIEACMLPDHTEHSGKTLNDLALRRRFGVSVVGIERQGALMMNPAATTTLYPLDELLLIGEPDSLEATQAFLMTRNIFDPSAARIEDVHGEIIPVPINSPRQGQTLAQINVSREFGVQIIGIERSGVKRLNPTGDEQIQDSDDLLMLGTSEKIQSFETWLQGDMVSDEQ